ncbi:MAG: AEC family transporter [Clostridia bacterium]|nr:AEC family transporter [Clostridia bacterium]
MEQLTGNIIAMFAIVVLSYLTKRWRLMPHHTNAVLSSLLYNVTAPCLIFISLVSSSGTSLLKEGLIVIGVALGYLTIACLVALWFLRKVPSSDTTAGVVAFTSIFSNTGFMGIPLVYLLFGASGVAIGALYDQAHNLFMFTLGTIMLGQKEGGFLITAARRLKEPPVIALGAGLLILVTGIKIPAPILEPVKMIGETTSALAMFAIGQFIDLNCFRDTARLKKLPVVAALRLVLIPLIVLGLTSLLPFPPLVRGVLGIMVAAPSAVMSAVLAKQYEQDYEFAVMAVVGTTAVSIISLPLVMGLL